MEGLQWRICHATSDYEISEYGHVRRRTPGRKTFPGKILSFCWHRAGYPRFKLTINCKHEYFEAHRLVAFAFHGCSHWPGAEVAHGDGDPTNNHFSNLSWKTRLDNEKDKFSHGTNPAGERNGGAKLTEADVKTIRDLRSQGLTLTAIGDEFGIAFQTVSKIANRDRWSHCA